VCGGALLGSCGNSNYDPPSKVESVRILATRADKPYALPGDKVTFEVLAFDGRSKKPVPMNLYWVPIPCVDPPGDAYYACYPGFEAVAPAGVDVTSKLTPGTQFSFTWPTTAITDHKGNRGNAPYGIAVAFTIACAGHVQVTPHQSGQGPNANPVGCFDDQGNQLGADDFVFAYSLAYAFTDRTNANPVIDHVAFKGTTVDLTAGVTMPHCGSGDSANCEASQFDVFVPASSQEVDPSYVDANGNVQKEQLWADFFVTDGAVSDDAIVLYDPVVGPVRTKNQYTPPQKPGDYQMWIVVHDNRGGAAWVQVPLHVT